MTALSVTTGICSSNAFSFLKLHVVGPPPAPASNSYVVIEFATIMHRFKGYNAQPTSRSFHPYIFSLKSLPFPCTPISTRLVSSTKLIKRPNALFVPFSLCDPERLFVFHDIGQNGTAEEDHVFSTGRVFDSDFEVLPSVLRSTHLLRFASKM